MNSQELHGVHPRWAGKTGRRHRPSSHQYLLDLDVDLAEELDVRMRLVARTAVTAVAFEVDTGEVDLSGWMELARSGPGVMVLDGVLATCVHVGDRVSAELIGSGDLIQPWRGEDEELLTYEVGYKALVPVRFALLDAVFAERIARWPQLSNALQRRVGRRTRRLNVQRAIAAQPRLDVRLALLLWHLGGRWGKVEPGGVRLPLPLTHQLLGRLVGAERPSVSHALARLANAGLVTGHGDEWHLHGSVDRQLPAMLDSIMGGVEPLSAASSIGPG